MIRLSFRMSPAWSYVDVRGHFCTHWLVCAILFCYVFSFHEPRTAVESFVEALRTRSCKLIVNSKATCLNMKRKNPTNSFYCIYFETIQTRNKKKRIVILLRWTLKPRPKPGFTFGGQDNKMAMYLYR